MNQEKRRKFKLFFLLYWSNHKRFCTLYIYLCCRAGNRMDNFLEYYRSWMADISYIRYFGESWEKVSLSENLERG